MTAGNPVYAWTLLGGVLLGLVFWSRLALRDGRLMLLYIGALLGAFLGAKLVYLAAEGWLYWDDPDRLLRWATGKTILGGLLGGYLAVEGMKKLLRYESATGDWFASIVPWGIILGRVGCFFNGCCGGVRCGPEWYTMQDAAGHARWPSVPVEILFNLFCLAVFWRMRRKKILPGQHFHLYLMGYGLFRFFHEFLRDCPRVAGPFTGYQAAALLVFLAGAVGYYLRARGGRGTAPERLVAEKNFCQPG